MYLQLIIIYFLKKNYFNRGIYIITNLFILPTIIIGTIYQLLYEVLYVTSQIIYYRGNEMRGRVSVTESSN
jgi:hypothetical protein